MESYPGKYPATVKSYDATSRTCRVEIPGITDGSEELPVAEIEYPIGDKSKSGTYSTEIEILPSDLVWIEFIGGDSRYPLITGARNPKTGNSMAWRKLHHANVGLTADSVFSINGTTVNITATDVAITSTTLKHNGVDIGYHHEHTNVQTGDGISGPPVGGGGGGSSGGGGGGGAIIDPGDGAFLADYWDSLS